VYSTDPNKIPVAKKIDKISYDEMLELSSLGAKVMQPSCGSNCNDVQYPS
jgi:aspartate kinase